MNIAMFIIFLQQFLCYKLLLIYIWIINDITFFKSIIKNLTLIICFEIIIDITFDLKR